MVGDELGSYRIVRKIGAGGMGTVWLAEHKVLGSPAAIKVLLPMMSAQDKIVQRFFDEARAATMIRDPGIVTVLDFGWHQGAAYIVMEHLSGQSLADRLGHDRMPAAQAVRLIQQCAIAMAAAHARGIVHRDLKPDNIFVVRDPAMPGGERIKILDFGIAKLLDDDTTHPGTQSGVIMGTPAFMSPEQCRGAGGVDHRTDIYALGCVLFNLVCGRPPFIAPTAGDMIASHLREVPPVPSALVPGLPPQIDELVARCLAKDAADRFQTMTELVRAGSVVSGDSLSIETIPPARPSSAASATVATATPAPTTLRGGAGEVSVAPARSRRGLLALGVVGVAALVAVVIAFARPRGESPAPVAAPVAPAVDAAPPADVAPPPDAPVAPPKSKKPPKVPPQTGSAKPNDYDYR